MVSFANGEMARNKSIRFGKVVPPVLSVLEYKLAGGGGVTLSRSACSRVMTQMDRDDERSLVARLRAGDIDAFDEVYGAYRPKVFAFLLRMSRSRTVAEDLLDETWLRLVRHARDLRPDTRIGPWLFTVARNLYWTYRRDSLVEDTHAPELALWPSSAPWPSPFELAAANELERRVERALSTLAPQYREVVLLIAHAGLTPADAAAVCGITPEALRQRLSRARAALAENLHDTAAAAASNRGNGTCPSLTLTGMNCWSWSRT